ncbi:MAG: hypothetical protein RBT73_09780 [Spirochaetia bacterium]|nr:hypothetical protein [Spirochaetia bacterium]
MKLRPVFTVLILMMALGFLGCDLAGGSDDDLGIPSSGADNTPVSADDAKALYLAASEAVFDKVNPLNDDDSKGITPKADADGFETIDFPLEQLSGNGLTTSGRVSGKTKSEMPINLAQGSYDLVNDITFDLNGTMDKFTVTDPNDPNKSYTVSGTLVHYMRMVMTMTMTVASDLSMTFSGKLDFELKVTTSFAVKRSDGTGARFLFVFEDNPAEIDLASVTADESGQVNGANAYDKKAKLYTYNDAGDLISESDVALKDTPWMMSDMMGGPVMSAGGGGGSGGGGSPDNPNQALIRMFLGALDKAVQAVGYTESVSGNVVTRTFNNYLLNPDNITLHGTESQTYSSMPLSPEKQTAGAMDITFSGTGITGTPRFILEMTVSGSPPVRTFTICTIDGVDMMTDYMTMAK